MQYTVTDMQMDKSRKQRFAVLLNWLAEKYPYAHAPRLLSVQDIADYYMVLSDVRIERLEWGAKYHWGHNDFFPNPGKLRAAAEMAPATVIPSLPKQREQIGEIVLPEERERVAAEMRAQSKALISGFYEQVGVKPLGNDKDREKRERVNRAKLDRQKELLRVSTDSGTADDLPG